jgi:hypothetical protein
MLQYGSLKFNFDCAASIFSIFSLLPVHHDVIALSEARRNALEPASSSGKTVGNPNVKSHSITQFSPSLAPPHPSSWHA